MIVEIIGTWRSLAIRGVAAIVFGVVALAWPRITLTVLVLLFGAYALVDGVSILVTLIADRDAPLAHRGTLLAEGVLGVVAGIVTFVWPSITALALLFVIAAWAIVTGAVEVAIAIKLRREIRNEWLLVLAGAFSLLFGVALLVRPGDGAIAITWLIGWYAILNGVLLASLALRLRKLETLLDGRARTLRHQPV
jgi:uncharacterized membrane protein HdeD (DUF308 family)